MAGIMKDFFDRSYYAAARSAQWPALRCDGVRRQRRQQRSAPDRADRDRLAPEAHRPHPDRLDARADAQSRSWRARRSAGTICSAVARSARPSPAGSNSASSDGCWERALGARNRCMPRRHQPSARRCCGECRIDARAARGHAAPDRAWTPCLERTERCLRMPSNPIASAAFDRFSVGPGRTWPELAGGRQRCCAGTHVVVTVPLFGVRGGHQHAVVHRERGRHRACL